MPIMIRPLSPVLAAALTAMSVEVLAAGFGPGSTATLLGQPLDFVVQVRADAGETITPECVSAEVLVGERRLGSALLRVSVEPAGDALRVRVTSSQVVDEPIVNVGLSLGCPPRLSRRFVVLAELPGSPAAAAAPSQALAPALVVPSAQEAGAQASSAPAASAASNGIGSTPATLSPAGTESSTNGPAGIAAGEAPRPAGGDRVVLRARPPGTAASGVAMLRPRPRPAVAASGAAPARRPPPVAQARPRLRLESAEPPPPPVQPEAIAQALAAVEQAASAARAAGAAASAAAVRITALERTVEQLRGEARASQEQATQLRQRLATSEESSRWMLPLAAAVLVLGALAGWLGWRLTALQRERRADWRAPGSQAAQAPSAETTQLASPTTSFVTVPAVGHAPAGARWHRGTPAWPPPAVTPIDPWVSSDLAPGEASGATPGGAGADVMKTQPLPPMSAVDEGAPRDVTIEELIDLEQQAEFFVVLGQDDAAIDLLVEHLRSTGGGSPLPYLKLLEIYRRRGDREAYERTRTRFNHRFNAYAPEWGADLAAGRSLDDYPGVVPRLQQVWMRPLDAMAELEALLFRKSRGELFDLPAYREVLLLYSLARDLLDRKNADASNVDFLLPMSEVTEFGATAPVPYLGLESDSAPLRDDSDRPTSPLDFDVTTSSKRPSLFGDLDPPSGSRGPGSGPRRPS